MKHSDGPFYPSLRNLITFLSFHIGIVADVKDEKGRFRIRAEVPGILGEGKKNWTPFIEVAGASICPPNSADGDEGIVWPLEVGQMVLVAFMAGCPNAMFAIVGPSTSDKDAGHPLTPMEHRIAHKSSPRDGTRVRAFKDPCGNTLFMDSRGKKEKGALIGPGGEGLFWVCPGSEEDENEKKGEGSQPRKGKRRGLRMVVNNTARKPSEQTRDGWAWLGLLGLGGGGFQQFSSDDQSVSVVITKTPDGGYGPTGYFDAKKNLAVITCGDVQFVLDGQRKVIQSTYPLVKNLSERIPVEDWIEKIGKGAAQEFDEFKEENL